MNKFLLATLGVAALAGQAVAADIPVKARPPVAPVVTWSSCYIGGYGASSWGEARNRAVSITPLVGGAVDGLDPTGEFRIHGYLIGGQVGCNYQFAANWVVGVEVDGAWANKRGDKNLDPAILDSRFVFDLRERWLVTARARIGYATEQWFLYATGGGAWADVRARLFFQPDPGGCSFCNATESQIFSGWTVGAGAELRLITNWSVKAEYLYVDLGKQTFFDPPGNTAYLGISTKLTQHIARVGINYHFNLGAPVVRAAY